MTKLTGKAQTSNTFLTVIGASLVINIPCKVIGSLDKVPSHLGAQSHTHLHTTENDVNQLTVHVFGLGEETEVPIENP